LLKLDSKLKTKVLFEISQIDKLFCDSKPLFDLCKIREPNFIELSAAAMVLQSFYNGIENILIMIIKHYEGQLPNSNKWHMELIDKAFESDSGRGVIFTDDIKEKLEEYMKFRHFARHAYGFLLKWEKIEILMNEIDSFWKTVKENINKFLENN